eukprot:TRINITY_DN5888_c0_g1_i1.p1 TRINITY_DN5888_c0_g1~~TRINITY_DN5888_c0_g1_i1.p1  ORF type:complete len:316 (+),score=92.95 TRINITY_DN5888_c0_g1_i1:21-968(+)
MAVAFYTSILLLAVLASRASAGIFPPEPFSSGTSEEEDYFEWLKVTAYSVAIIVGSIVTVLGYRWLRFTLLVTAWCLIATPIFVFLQTEGLEGEGWWALHLLIAVVFFLAVSSFLLCFRALLGVFAVGGLTGGWVTLVLLSGFVAQGVSDPSVGWYQAIVWICTLVVGLAMGFTGTFLLPPRPFLVACSSIFGSYILTVGFDYFTKDGFASVVNFAFSGQSPAFLPLWLSFVALFIWAVFAVLGGAIQWKITSIDVQHPDLLPNKDYEDDDYRNNGDSDDAEDYEIVPDHHDRDLLLQSEDSLFTEGAPVKTFVR